MDDEVDFDDLLGEERVVESMTTKRSNNDLSQSAGPAPSANEIRLGRRVLELEREREVFVTEINELRAQQSISPSIPSPSDETTLPPINIPHNLLPTLEVLRRHIAELSRDNAALRYTFLGQPATSSRSPSALSRGASARSTPAQGQTGPLVPTLEQVSINDDQMAGGSGLAGQGVDLDKVLKRVKAVMLENEELGEMLLEAGRNEGGSEEWEKALEESKAVIQSLDSDLTHHLSTIQNLRSEIQNLKSAQSSNTSGHRPTHSKTPSMSLNPASSIFSPPRGPSRRTLDVGPGYSTTIKSEPGSSSMSGTNSGSGSMGGRGGGKHRDGDREVGKEPPKGPREDRDVKRRR